MTTTPLDPRTRVLDAAKDAVLARMRADRDLLVSAAEWAVLHPATEATDYAGYGIDLLFGEALTPLAGAGAPLVAEFAPAELAAALGWSTETVKELMGDALELAHRLPKLWAHVTELRQPVPLARYAAQQTRDLDPQTAKQADRMLACGHPGKLTRPQIKRIVDEQRLYEDPDRAAADEETALAARRVEVRPGATPATNEINAEVDTPDGEAFDQAVSEVAEALKQLGDTDDLDVRRAHAIGILADPQAALDLLKNAQLPQDRTRKAKVELFLHLNLATLAVLALQGLTGPVYDEQRGVATTDLIRGWFTTWLGDDTFIPGPATCRHRGRGGGSVKGLGRGGRRRISTNRGDHAADAPPQLRHRASDVGIRPQPKPRAAETHHPDNLAPLCRHHHRVKTHGRWHYRRLPHGGYQWTTPTGHTLDVPPARR